jgi:predicted ATP-grasp superfamily ATP-dependent carboligase
MPGRVAVLHHRRSFFAPDLREAVGDAAELLWVLVDPDPDDGATKRLLRHLGRVVEIKSDELDAAAEVLASCDLDGIVTFVDDHLVLAAGLAARLGLRYHSPEVAATISNKRRQRERLNDAGVPGARLWTLAAALELDQLRLRAEQITYPAVLKPAYGSASRGITALASADDLIDLYDPQTEQYVEQYLNDDPNGDPRFASYLSVESVVSHGEVSHVAICGRFPLADHYRETGNFIPAPVSASTQAALFEVTDAAIAALAITDAVLHTEIKLTPDGPRVIEVNGRLGGRPPFVLRSVSEVNLFQIACHVAMGAPVRLEEMARCDAIGYWRMLQPPAGASAVRELRGVSELKQLDAVDMVVVSRGAGQPIDPALGTDGAVITVRGRVDDLNALARTIELIDRTIEINYELVDGAGPDRSQTAAEVSAQRQ